MNPNFQIQTYEPRKHLKQAAAIVDATYKRYGDPGVELDGYDKDLTEEPNPYRLAGGEMVTLIEEDKVLGIHAYLPMPEAPPGVAQLRRLYVDQEVHGKGAGRRLMDWAIKAVQDKGFHRIEFWSDTRFTRAHSFFAKYGFVKTGEIKTCHDYQAVYQEFKFFLDLKGYQLPHD